MVTDQNKTVVPGQRHDYMPFGGSLLSTQNGRTTTLGYGVDEALASLSTLFTGKERDAETGLDYFGARYMSSAQGRFTSPDLPLVDQRPKDPQSWNLYGYVRSNPLRYTDATGEACVVEEDGTEHNDDNPGQSCEDVHKQENNDKPSAVVTDDSSPAPYTYEYYRQVARDLPTLLERGNRPDMINDLYSIFGYDQNVPLPSCFGKFLSATGDDLMPFSPGASTAGSASGEIGSAIAWNKALRCAAQMSQRTAKGVFKDGRFQRLLGISTKLETSAPLLGVVFAEGHGLLSECDLMRSGGCQ
ncbi:RHS repeat-associated core domain-containing protein [Paludibaculum fermentans]|uniref:RHS repeat-associated core domain-containing protein n=1 Tax=Paludibaculum fermentans TaxID=1473598 RepID=A0A7S7SP01_PALFE|nr:RHS repeat-associated core domain-containing protein [Paludibaculum fermentans]QOY90655.1 RHS repeat-associated core domain-containing protein [Paludibaculum fermentans]